MRQEDRGTVGALLTTHLGGGVAFAGQGALIFAGEEEHRERRLNETSSCLITEKRSALRGSLRRSAITAFSAARSGAAYQAAIFS